MEYVKNDSDRLTFGNKQNKQLNLYLHIKNINIYIYQIYKIKNLM